MNDNNANGLEMAAASASTSYRAVLPPALLREILLTGVVPAEYQAHMYTLLDEVPLELVEGAMRQAAADNPGDLAMIQRHVKAMSAAWKMRPRTPGDYMRQTQEPKK